MHVVFLLHQTADSAAHRNHVVIGMGREHYDALRIGLGTLRACRVVHIRLASWPARDGVLQLVEHLYVHQSCLSVELLHEVSEAIIHIVLSGEFQQGLAHLLA